MEAAANDEAAAATQPAGIMTTPPQPGQASRPAKLGSWSLDKSKVKKLGIKSSLLQALTKLNKSSTTGDNTTAPLASPKPEPQPAAAPQTAPAAPPPKASNLLQQISASFNSKFKHANAADVSNVSVPAKPQAQLPAASFALQSAEMQRVKELQQRHRDQLVLQTPMAPTQRSATTPSSKIDTPPSTSSPTKQPITEFTSAVQSEKKSTQRRPAAASTSSIKSASQPISPETPPPHSSTPSKQQQSADSFAASIPTKSNSARRNMKASSATASSSPLKPAIADSNQSKSSPTKASSSPLKPRQPNPSVRPPKAKPVVNRRPTNDSQSTPDSLEKTMPAIKIPPGPVAQDTLAAKLCNKTAASLGLGSDNEADDEISDADSQRQRDLLRAAEVAAAATTAVSTGSVAAAAAASSATKPPQRMRRLKPQPVLKKPLVPAYRSRSAAKAPQSHVNPPPVASDIATNDGLSTPLCTTTSTTTDDDESTAAPAPANPQRPVRQRRQARPRSNEGEATAKPIPVSLSTAAASASAASGPSDSVAILSDNTVDYIVGTLPRRCDELAVKVDASFPAASWPPAPQPEQTPPIAGVVQINRLLDKDRALVMSLLKGKRGKGKGADGAVESRNDEESAVHGAATVSDAIAEIQEPDVAETMSVVEIATSQADGTEAKHEAMTEMSLPDQHENPTDGRTNDTTHHADIQATIPTESPPEHLDNHVASNEPLNIDIPHDIQLEIEISPPAGKLEMHSSFDCDDLEISPNASTSSFHGFSPPPSVHSAEKSPPSSRSPSPQPPPSIQSSSRAKKRAKPSLLALLADRVNIDDLRESLLMVERSRFETLSDSSDLDGDDDDDDDDDADEKASQSTAWSSVRNYFSMEPSENESTESVDNYDEMFTNMILPDPGIPTAGIEVPESETAVAEVPVNMDDRTVIKIVEIPLEPISASAPDEESESTQPNDSTFKSKSSRNTMTAKEFDENTTTQMPATTEQEATKTKRSTSRTKSSKNNRTTATAEMVPAPLPDDDQHDQHTTTGTDIPCSIPANEPEKHRRASKAEKPPVPKSPPSVRLTRRSQQFTNTKTKDKAPSIARKRTRDRKSPEQSTPCSKRTRSSIKDYFSPTTSPSETTQTPAIEAIANDPDTSPEATIPVPKTPTTSRRKRSRKRSASQSAKPSTKRATAAEKPPVSVTCGNCKASVPRSSWKVHLRLHYGQAWIEGEEEALLMEPLQRVGNRMQLWAKRNGITFFTCSKCKGQKKSGVGHLSHMEICGLTGEDIANTFYKCPNCPAQVRNVSIASHRLTCPGLRQLKQQQQQQDEQDDGQAADEKRRAADEESPLRQNNAGRCERKSAAKARDRFKEMDKADDDPEQSVVERVTVIRPVMCRSWSQALERAGRVACRNCTFNARSVQEMSEHFMECDRVQPFECKVCKERAATRELAVEHVRRRHLKGTQAEPFEDSGSDGFDGASSTSSSDEDEASGDAEEESSSDNAADDDDVDVDENYVDDGDRKSKKKEKKSKKSTEKSKSHNHAESQVLPDRKFLEVFKSQFQHVSRLKIFYPPAKVYTQAFHTKHFSTVQLHADILPGAFETLPDRWPPVFPQSPSFQQLAVTHYLLQIGNSPISADGWRQLPAFGTTSSPRAHILFAGAPVQCTHWIPLPDDYNPADEQYLAVVTKPSADFRLFVRPNADAAQCSVLQLWSLRGLPAAVKKTAATATPAEETANDSAQPDASAAAADEPRLRYTVHLDSGPVLCVAMMPSGGFAGGSDGERLAVAAIPTHGGDIRLVGLPRPERCVAGEAIRLRDAGALVLRSTERAGQVSRLAWSKTAGHQTIAAGYVTGVVVVWNLRGVGNPLLEDVDENGGRVLAFTHVLRPCVLMITQLNLHHDSEGNDRWLIVGSLDKRVKFFDLFQPDVEVTQVQHKSRVMGGAWPLNWTMHFSVVDDAYWSNVCGIMGGQSLGLGTGAVQLFSSPSAVNDVDFSDWLNTYIFVNESGEIRTGFCSQLLLNFGDKPHRSLRALLGYTDVVPVAMFADNSEGDGAQNESTEADRKPELQDGVVFCDFKSPYPMPESAQTLKQRTPEIAETRSMRITTVDFNPNSSAFKLYALGYETGFVRICHIRRI